MELTIKQVQEFSQGLLRWIESGEITLSDLLKGKDGYMMVKYLFDSPLIMDLDSTFNGMTKDELDDWIDCNMYYWDRLNSCFTGISQPLWIGCPASDQTPQVRVKFGEAFYAISIENQQIIAGVADEISNNNNMPALHLEELRMWLRLNRQALLEYWAQSIDTVILFARLIRLPKNFAGISNWIFSTN